VESKTVEFIEAENQEQLKKCADGGNGEKTVEGYKALDRKSMFNFFCHCDKYLKETI
jgi:hypothetical protein